LVCDLLAPEAQSDIEAATRSADIGIFAADNEPAKFHWDALMRCHGKPWTLGEVLSGGIGGFVHWFVPGGPCYGCVASHLQRSVAVEKPAAPDYAQPGGPVAETTVPAGKASIQAIAALHALVTQGLPASVPRRKGDFLLRVPGREPLPADNLRRDDGDDRCRLTFRLPTPPSTVTAELSWRNHPLGQLALPVLGRTEFLQRLGLQM